MKNKLPIPQTAQSADKSKLTALLLVGSIFALMAPDVFAATGADDFQAIYLNFQNRMTLVQDPTGF